MQYYLFIFTKIQNSSQHEQQEELKVHLRYKGNLEN